MQCTPRSKIWDSSTHGTCINESALLNTSGFFNTITDYIILILPISSVLRLQLSRTKKILVVLVFTFGLWYAIQIFRVHKTSGLLISL